MNKLVAILFLIFFARVSSAQQVAMEFPHMAGKTYDFIIFQGDLPVVLKDTIPASGKFVLSVPEQYHPYTGMSRWLITNTQEGGGLDMLIEGKNFSVSCLSPQPNDANIAYIGGEGTKQLSLLYAEQQIILNKFTVMSQSIKVYSEKDKAYRLLKGEYNEQIAAFNSFRKKLASGKPYLKDLLTIVNIITGVGLHLGVTERELASDITAWIENDMDWQVLYTSGHWGGVIGAWYDLHSLVLKDGNELQPLIEKILKKLKPAQQQAFMYVIGRKAMAANQ